MSKEKYNHDRGLPDFTEQIEIIKTAGFNPVAVSQLYLEDTFVFETEAEAHKAYNALEQTQKGKWIGNVVGWWYGKTDFLETVKQYELEIKSKVLIHWL